MHIYFFKSTIIVIFTYNLKTNKMICITCNGTKKISVTMNELKFVDGAWKTVEGNTSKLDCIDCDGTGEVTQEEADAIEFEKNMWCKCDGDSLTDSKYYEDGEHPDVYKHHYRHRKCGGVTQIG